MEASHSKGYQYQVCISFKIHRFLPPCPLFRVHSVHTVLTCSYRSKICQQIYISLIFNSYYCSVSRYYIYLTIPLLMNVEVWSRFFGSYKW